MLPISPRIRNKLKLVDDIDKFKTNHLKEIAARDSDSLNAIRSLVGCVRDLMFNLNFKLNAVGSKTSYIIPLEDILDQYIILISSPSLKIF